MKNCFVSVDLGDSKITKVAGVTKKGSIILIQAGKGISYPQAKRLQAKLKAFGYDAFAIGFMNIYN